MAVLANKIRKADFKTSIRGYDKVEVDAYLEVLADEVEIIAKENNQLKEKISRFEKEIREFEIEKQRFKMDQKNIQKELSGLKIRAEKESKIILMDAKLKAENISNEAYRELNKLRKDIDELKEIKESILTRFRLLIREQENIIDTFSKDVKFTLNKKDLND